MLCNLCCTLHMSLLNGILFLNIDGAMHFICSHKYNTISVEDSSYMNIQIACTIQSIAYNVIALARV